MCVGKKGYDILRREYASLIIERVDFREVKQMSFAQAETVADKVMSLFDAGGIRRLHAVLFGVQISDQPGPDRAAADSGLHLG
jgi:F0F1-type ATP synthase gamma subunit